MICTIRNKNEFCKRVYLDIWGYARIYKKRNSVIRFLKYLSDERQKKGFFLANDFSFDLAKRIGFARKKRLDRRFFIPRIIKSYYLTLSWRNLHSMYKKSKKMKGFFISNFLYHLEGRLFMILYRANFINNLFAIKNVLKSNIFYINGKVKSQCNFQIKKGDLITVRWDYIEYIKTDMILRLRGRDRKIVWKSPEYMFISYVFFFIFMHKNMKFKDVVYPTKMKKGLFWVSEYFR